MAKYIGIKTKRRRIGERRGMRRFCKIVEFIVRVGLSLCIYKTQSGWDWEEEKAKWEVRLEGFLKQKQVVIKEVAEW